MDFLRFFRFFEGGLREFDGLQGDFSGNFLWLGGGQVRIDLGFKVLLYGDVGGGVARKHPGDPSQHPGRVLKSLMTDDLRKKTVHSSE